MDLAACPCPREEASPSPCLTAVLSDRRFRILNMTALIPVWLADAGKLPGQVTDSFFGQEMGRVFRADFD